MFEVIYAGVSILLMLVLMVANFDTVGVLTLVNLILFFGGIIDLKETLVGFSNQGILSVIAFYPLLIPIINSIQVNEYTHRLFMCGSSKPWILMIKIIVPVFFLSFFINNTPIVFLYLSFIKKWCITTENYPSLFLIPLSYASILGGTNTLVGTSTNLLAKGLVADQGFDWNLFETGRLSLIPSTVALIATGVLAHFLLPKNTYQHQHSREMRFKCQVTVPLRSILVGMNARNWIGGHLEMVKIKRQVNWFAVNEDTRLEPSDELMLYCSPDELINFVQEYQSHISSQTMGGHFDKVHLIHKLAEIRGQEYETFISDMRGKDQFYKIIPSEDCPINETRIGNLEFEKRYLGIVFAVSNQDVKRNPVDDVTSVNDTVITSQTCLLVYSTSDFIREHCNSDHFTSVTRYRGNNIKPNNYDKVFRLFGKYRAPLSIRNWHISLFLFLLVIGLSASNLVSIVVLASISILIQSILRIVDLRTVIDSINWSIYLILALSVPIGSAVVNSGIDRKISELFVLMDYHLLLVLAVIGAVTLALTNLISNATTVTIMVPIAGEIAKSLKINGSLLMLFVTCLSSVALCTPYSYQTNLMVQREGSYRLLDYSKLGVAVSLIYYLFILGMGFLLFTLDK
jgi:di/tricarboxylate transporter